MLKFSAFHLSIISPFQVVSQFSNFLKPTDDDRMRACRPAACCTAGKNNELETFASDCSHGGSKVFPFTRLGGFAPATGERSQLDRALVRDRGDREVWEILGARR